MYRSEIFVVQTFLVAVVISVLKSSHGAANLSTPNTSESTVASTSRRGLIHCEITIGASDKRPEIQLAASAKRVIVTPTNTSGSGCVNPDAVTSLTLKIAADYANELDLLPICRYSNVERFTVVGRLLNESVTSFNCFRNIRHMTLKHADIDVIQPWLINNYFRSGDFRSVEVSDSGVEQLASGVFDGRWMRYLEDLDLTFNNLTKINNSTFINLATLQTLNLSHNAIRYVAPNAFANTDTRYLYIFIHRKREHIRK